MSDDRERRRVATQADCAAFLGISTSRPRSMPSECKWWEDGFVTSEGWDVVGIAKAQAEWNLRRKFGAGTTTTTTEEEKRIASANVVIAEETAAAKTLDRRSKERRDGREEGALVEVEVVCRTLSEAFVGLQKQLSDLPFVFAQQVPPEFLPLVYVEGTRLESPEVDDGTDVEYPEPALLQRLVEDVETGYGQLLDLAASEIFDDDEGAA